LCGPARPPCPGCPAVSPTAVYVLSRLWARHAARHVQVCRRFEERAFAGDQVRVELEVSNGGRVPIPWLEVWESVPMELRNGSGPSHVFGLGGRKQRRFAYTLTCRRRGQYRPGPMTVQTGDVLGIEERLVTLQEPKQVVVYPRLVPLEQLGLPSRSALAAKAAVTPLFEDTTRLAGVRDYLPGDPPRRIHWRATARTGQLLVKQYQPAITRETLICLDLSLDGYPVARHDAVEQAIVVAASLINHIVVREGLPAGLACEARDGSAAGHRVSIPPRSGRVQLINALEILARVEPEAGQTFPDLVRRESVNLSWGATVVAVTGQIEENLAESLLYLKHAGYAAALVLVGPMPRRADSEMLDDLAGVPIYRVWPAAQQAVS